MGERSRNRALRWLARHGMAWAANDNRDFAQEEADQRAAPWTATLYAGMVMVFAIFAAAWALGFF